jgi:hypothetical protein
MLRRAAAAAALLLCASAVACGAESPGRERGVVVLPAPTPGADGAAAAPLVLLHEQLAREVSRGAGGAALLTTETPLVDYWCASERCASQRRRDMSALQRASAARRMLRVAAAAGMR